MTETPIKITVDCSTGIVTEESLTAEEIAEREAQALQAAEEQAQHEAEEAQKAQDRADAIAALEGLGLTEAQINALIA
jgi:Holliday junction resolvasome RuvABC DNA-binding subunit